jgi:hypothetical protein
MRFEGRTWKDGEHWLIEVPALCAMTQGYSEAEAFEMIRDLVETMADRPGFEAAVHPLPDGQFELGANDSKVLVALMLRRQRESRGITLAQAAARLEQKSRNAYARYEQGQAVPTVEKLEELLTAVAPDQKLIWRLAG